MIKFYRISKERFCISSNWLTMVRVFDLVIRMLGKTRIATGGNINYRYVFTYQ